MKVSIVIPVYHVAPYIAACLQSVMAQTWQGQLECILVDDGGTDDSMAVAEAQLKDYAGSIDFRIVHHERNRGLSAARNTGTDAATGDYVYFLDSDDEITPDCIECLARPLSDEAYDLVVGDYQILGSDMDKPPLLLQDGAVLRGKDVLRAYRRAEWYMMSVNKLYRTDFLRQHRLNFYEGIIHEDELWSFQIACLAQSLCAVGRETYLYKVRAGSITAKKDQKYRCDSISVILYEMHRFAKENHLQGNKDVHDVQRNFLMIMMYSVYKDSPSFFRSFYMEQRQAKIISWEECFWRNGFDIRKQLRDLHQLLPVSLAMSYLKLLFCFLNMRHGR